MIRTIRYAVACFALVVLVLEGLTRCASWDSGAADAAYATEHLRCVDNYNTRQEIDACRAGVRLRWHIAETVTDAGREQ